MSPGSRPSEVDKGSNRNFSSRQNLAAGGLGLAAAGAYAAISLFRHYRFGSTIDLATQTQTIWGYSRFEVIPNTVIGVPNLEGDHFHPILAVLAPLFWIWDSAAVLLIAQAVLLGVAGIPIFLWGRQRLGLVAGLAFQASFYLYWGILAGVLFDFHHVVFAVTAVSGALFATVTRRNLLLVVAVAAAMLSREDTALTLVALGVYIALVQRRWVLGAAVAVLNVAWFALLLQVVMPALVGEQYRHWTYSRLGTGPLSATLHVLLHPLASLQLLFEPVTKVRVWLASFGNWLFLPLLSPLTIVALPDFLERFWNDGPDFWNFHMQYSMPVAPVLAFAAIDGAARVSAWLSKGDARVVGTRIALGCVAVSAIVTIAVNPLSELSTYVPASTAADIQSCLDVIPGDASVAATQNLLPHLATRTQIYTIPAQVSDRVFEDPVKLGVDYLAIDVATEGNDQLIRPIFVEALDDGYGVACSHGTTLVLRRSGGDQALTPQLERWLAGECSYRECSKP